MAVFAAEIFHNEIFNVPAEEVIPATIEVSHLGSTNIRLERIYASIAGHEAPRVSRDTHFLMSRIGRELGINLTSGMKTFEQHLMRLYQEVAGTPWAGDKYSTELILRGIESHL